VKSIVACFSDDAVVHDEGEQLRGEKAIESWAAMTIEKYRLQYKLLTAKTDADRIVVAIEVSGTFPGSPVTLDYHFIVTNDKITSLAVD